MALTVEGAELTEAHRLAQAQIGAETVSQMFNLWQLLDVNNLESTFAQWLDLVETVVNAQRARSAELGAAYVDTFKKLELGPAAVGDLTLATLVELDKLTSSMLATGPGAIEHALSLGVDPRIAAEVARARSAASAQRHANNGGRQTILSDKTALGWQRVCSGDPCSFCAMLASRGPVYRSVGSADFQAHDSCHCYPEPVYKRGPLNDQAHEFRQQWNETTKGLRGNDALNAFRSARS